MKITFKQALDIQLQLPLHTIQAFTAKLDQYFSRIDDSNPLENLSLLATFKDHFPDWEDRVRHNLRLLQQDLHTGIYDSVFMYGGFAEVGIVLSRFVGKIDGVDQFVDYINSQIAEGVEALLADIDHSQNNCEFIYGLAGTLRYTLSQKYRPMRRVSEQIVTALVARSQAKNILGHVVPGWHYYPDAMEMEYMTDKPDHGVINYGLSHGMAGPLAALAMAYGKGIRVEGLEDAVQGLFSIYRQGAYAVDGIPHWPGRIPIEDYIEETPHKHPRQQSWCYGSLGILQAMHNAAKQMGYEKEEDYATEALIKIADLPIPDYLLHAPIICHGYAGTVSVMDSMSKNIFYDMKNAKKLMQAGMAQAILCIEAFIAADFDHIEPDKAKRVDMFSYLEGWSGVLQTLASFLVDASAWHKARLFVCMTS